MAFTTVIQKFNPGTWVTLWKFDFTTCFGYDPSKGGPSVCYFSAFTGTDGNNIVFNGQEYQYVDVESSGFTAEMGGTLPEPSLIISFQYLPIRNGLGYYEDIRAATITRIGTFVQYLDNGSTPDVTQSRQTIWCVDSLESFNKRELTFKLCVTPGLERLNENGVRSNASGKCALAAKYRLPADTADTFTYTPLVDGGCPYGNPEEAANYPAMMTGKYYDVSDNETTNYREDRCSGTVMACIYRFDPGELQNPLPEGFEPSPLPYSGTLRGGTNKTGDIC